VRENVPASLSLEESMSEHPEQALALFFDGFS
jgi:hypothetical protein